MALYIVAGYHTINKFKTCKYFRVNLGLSATIEKNGTRAINEKDKFASFYYSLYRSNIYAQGNVGDIRFYTDHYIKDSAIATYYNDNYEEFLFEWNDENVQSKGVEGFLGYILKSVEEQYEEKIKKQELRKLEEKPQGNPDLIIQNPGNVSYADVKAFLEKRQKERYKNK